MESRNPQGTEDSLPPQAPAVQYNSAEQFFRNEDLCTVFTKVMILDSRAVLAFRGITRQTWNACMKERNGRKALMLLPQPARFQGVLQYYLADHYPSTTRFIPARKYPFMRDAASFINGNKPSKSISFDNPVGGEAGVAQVITLHPALRSIFISPAAGSMLAFRSSNDIANAPPLHMDMFLTQPPQKWIASSRVCYHVCGGLPVSMPPFRILVEGGIRLRDLVEYFQEERKSLRHICTCWQYTGAVSKESVVGKRACLNAAKLAQGEVQSEDLFGYDNDR